MRIFSSLREDAQQGWAWLQVPSLPSRSIVKITNQNASKSVYCEALQIDDNFLNAYNQAPRISITDPKTAVVLNSWYRQKLGGLATQQEAEVQLAPANSNFGRFMACVHHPQAVVRMAAWLGAVGVALGVIGIILGSISFVPRPQLIGASQPRSHAPEHPRLEQLFLYASLKDGYLVGRVFNQEETIVIERITVEAVPKEENPFNKFEPRLFEVPVQVSPRTMSPEFRVETGVLNPEFHKLRIASAVGRRRDE